MSDMTAPVAIALSTPSPIYSPNAELKMDYANFATLQVLEEELDRLRKERQARRLSMLSEATIATSASPPPQFKRRASILDIQSPPPSHSQQQEEEEVMSQLPPVDSLDQRCNTSQEEVTVQEQTEVSSSSHSSSSSSISEEQFGESSDSSLDDSDNEEINIHKDRKESPIGNQTAAPPPMPSSSIQKTEASNPTEKEGKLDVSLVQSNDHTGKKPTDLSKETVANEENKSEQNVVVPPKPSKSKLIQQKRKPPLRIQTMFDRHQLAAEQNTQQNNKKVQEENALLLHARRNLKSTPSPPPLATVPPTSKSTSALYKLDNKYGGNSNSQDKVQESVGTAKRALLELQSSRSAQTTNLSTTPLSNSNFLQRRRQEDNSIDKKPKPRPLSDAFIGVKGLSKKFDSTTSESLASTKRSAKFFMRDEPLLLSPASQSVSRGRKTSMVTPTTSTRTGTGVSALSQLFSSSSSSSSSPGSPKEKPHKSKQSMCQHKPLPPVKQHHLQQQTTDHNKKRIDAVTPTVSMSLPTRSNSKKAESHRIFHKTMPAIPVTNSNSSDRSPPLLSRYPNPLPVYMPQLAHPTNHQQQSPEQIKVAETAAVEVKPLSSAKPVTTTTTTTITTAPPAETSTGAVAKKRVSFSSVITSIPPPSPFSDEESEDETNKRRPLMTMSSAHLLSLWQQKHEKDLRATTAITPSSSLSTSATSSSSSSTRDNPSSNDTRGFWEAFSTEMNNRAAPDLRRAAVAKEKQQPTTSSSSPLPTATTMTATNRFIPSTFAKNSGGGGGGGKPLPPIVSNEKQEQPLSPRKTWINLLQDRLGKKSSSESILENSPPKALARPGPVWGMNATRESSSTSQHQQQNNKSAIASRNPIVASISFDDYPTSTTPPLHHPTKTRPKKPSSFRKSQGHHHHQLRSNLVGPEVSVPPVAVQRPWHRNY